MQFTGDALSFVLLRFDDIPREVTSRLLNDFSFSDIGDDQTNSGEVRNIQRVGRNQDRNLRVIRGQQGRLQDRILSPASPEEVTEIVALRQRDKPRQGST